MDKVCLLEDTLVFDLTLLRLIGRISAFLGLRVAYVMYNAMERMESVDMLLLRIDLKASMKYVNVFVVKTSPLSASNHFLAIPGRICKLCRRAGFWKRLTHP